MRENEARPALEKRERADVATSHRAIVTDGTKELAFGLLLLAALLAVPQILGALYFAGVIPVG